MFKINAKPQFSTEIDVTDAAGTSGTFTATYLALDDRELDAFDMKTVDGVKAMLRATVVALGDLAGDDDKPLPYSPDVLERMLERQFLRARLVTGYFRAIVAARQGN